MAIKSYAFILTNSNHFRINASIHCVETVNQSSCDLRTVFTRGLRSSKLRAAVVCHCHVDAAPPAPRRPCPSLSLELGFTVAPCTRAAVTKTLFPIEFHTNVY